MEISDFEITTSKNDAISPQKWKVGANFLLGCCRGYIGPKKICVQNPAGSADGSRFGCFSHFLALKIDFSIADAQQIGQNWNIFQALYSIYSHTINGVGIICLRYKIFTGNVKFGWFLQCKFQTFLMNLPFPWWKFQHDRSLPNFSLEYSQI